VKSLYYSLLIVGAILTLPACEWFARKEPKAVSKMQGIIIDTLAPESYKEVHISGAINIPFLTPEGTQNPAFESRQAFEEAVKAALNSTPNEATPIFVYCTNDACTTSDLVAQALKKFGFNAHAYKNGLAGWVTLNLYSDKKERFGVTPAITPGKQFVYAPYLNALVAAKPEEVTPEKLSDLSKAAQPLVDASQAAA
jgi:rhodanese-related sulfurtransferase